MTMGEIRIGRWVLRWVPRTGPLPAEWVLGRFKRQ